MKYIKIVDWEKFQHYKKRNPPWIKLHTQLLDNDNFDCLHDDSKLLLLCLWLFTARKGNGNIPANEKWLQKKLPLQKKVKLQPLIDKGFIECYQDDSKLQAIDASKVLASDRERDREREETEGETKTEYILFFNEARKIFPSTKRGNQTEFDNFVKKHKDWKKVLPLLKPAIEQQIQIREKTTGFVPNWKNFQTWINNRCWEEELKITESGQPRETVYEQVERMKAAGEL